MVTLISHFFNEEYLLPFWIEHHLPMFDDAILIDHGSTDKSREIIRNLAPNWRIVDSRLKEFDAVLTDFEVEKYESDINGWKIVLNTTEFLVGSLRQELGYFDKKKVKAVTIDAKIMVDLEPEKIISPNSSLVIQKPFGIIDNRLYDLLLRGFSLGKIRNMMKSSGRRHIGRQRLLHCHTIGGYSAGRHSWPYASSNTQNLFIYWYGYSPWDTNMLIRKSAIKDKLPADNLHLGSHHRLSLQQLNRVYRKHVFLWRVFFLLSKFSRLSGMVFSNVRNKN